MIKINMHEEGFDFEGYIAKLKNPRPLLAQVADVIKVDIEDRITSTKVDPEGKPWAAWAPSTAKARMKDGTFGLGLLNHGGGLLGSLVPAVLQNRSADGRYSSGFSAVVTATAPYAGFLQNGTRNMPARPFMGISQQANEDIIDLVNAYLDV